MLTQREFKTITEMKAFLHPSGMYCSYDIYPFVVRRFSNHGTLGRVEVDYRTRKLKINWKKGGK